jgi:hypothetical protein
LKVFFAALFFLFIHADLNAQVPQALNYQAVARKQDGSILANQAVGIRFSVLEGSTNGGVLYQETHQTTTNNFGLFTLAIGSGNALSGSFSAINWAIGPKFLRVEIALQGSSSYQLQGVTQLLSVPYALYAEKSNTPGPQGPAGPQGVGGPMGAQGPMGQQGVRGETGPAGPQGLPGPTGPAGVAGPQGPTGAVGPAGATGPAGAKGAKGEDGKTILNGKINPSGTTGVDGDFYINTATNQLFGPKTAGVWGAGVDLTGPQGPAGIKSLIDLEYFPSNVNCIAGGVTVKSGVDQNKNNVLDANEVDNSKSICFTQSSNPLDKLIILPINWSANTTSTTPVSGIGVVKFNKANYPGVDSIILVCNPYVGNSNNTAVVQLLNFTDNAVVNNSTISTSNLFSTSAQAYLSSGNVFSSLPNYEVALGVSLKSGSEGIFAATGSCYLYLYRR